MSLFRYQLEQYKGMTTKHRCPACEHEKKFTRYVNIETNEYLSDKVGRCDRSDKCGYHYTPKQFFSDNINYSGLPQPSLYSTSKTNTAKVETNQTYT